MEDYTPKKREFKSLWILINIKPKIRFIENSIPTYVCNALRDLMDLYNPETPLKRKKELKEKYGASVVGYKVLRINQNKTTIRKN